MLRVASALTLLYEFHEYESMSMDYLITPFFSQYRGHKLNVVFSFVWKAWSVLFRPSIFYPKPSRPELQFLVRIRVGVGTSGRHGCTRKKGSSAANLAALTMLNLMDQAGVEEVTKDGTFSHTQPRQHKQGTTLN